jgi:hypothetical protein
VVVVVVMLMWRDSSSSEDFQHVGAEIRPSKAAMGGLTELATTKTARR